MTIPDLETIDSSAIQGIVSIKSSDGSLLARLISLYKEESPTLISQIAEGIKNSDVGQVLSSSHSLKSTSATLGALKLADYARELEKMARAEDISNGCQFLEDIRDEHNKVVDDLDILISSI